MTELGILRVQVCSGSGLYFEVDSPDSLEPVVFLSFGAQSAASDLGRPEKREFVWNLTQEFKVHKQAETLVVTCCNGGARLGRLSIPLTRLPANDTVAQWYSLFKDNGDVSPAALYLTLQYTEFGEPLPCSCLQVSPSSAGVSPANSRDTSPHFPPRSLQPVSVDEPSHPQQYMRCRLVDYVAVVGAPEPDIASACDSIETSLSTVGQSPAYRWRLERQQSRRSKRIASKSSSCDSRNMDVDNQSVSSLSSLEGVLETGNPTNDGPDGGNCSADRVLKEGLKVDSHTVLSRFPASDHCDNPFPTRLEWFTFPSGYKLRPFTESHGLPSTTAVKIHHRPPPSFTSFVLASKLGPVDLKLYGVALILHPTVRKNCTIPSYPDVSVDVSAPIAVVILSRYPFVREMQKILWHAYLSAHRHHSNGPFEMFSDLVRALVHEVPVPVPGSLSIKFSLKHESVTLSLPDAASFPKIAFPVSVVLKRFKPDVITRMLSALMCERKLLFHSNHPELLAPASDVILALLYPLQWQCLYVPVLPAGIASDCLQAPVPFVYGMITTELDDVMDTMKTRGTELDLDDVLFVNIDTGFAALGYGTGHHQAAEFHAIDPLPSPLVLQFQVNLAEMDAMFQLPSLCSRMHHGHDGGGHSADGHAGAVIMSTLDATEDVQAVFCSFYAMLLEGYRNCLYFPHQSSLPSFSVQRFLFVQQSASYPFFIKFFQSQMFASFLESHSSPSLSLFHAFCALVPKLRDPRGPMSLFYLWKSTKPVKPAGVSEPVFTVSLQNTTPNALSTMTPVSEAPTPDGDAATPTADVSRHHSGLHQRQYAYLVKEFGGMEMWPPTQLRRWPIQYVADCCGVDVDDLRCPPEFCMDEPHLKQNLTIQVGGTTVPAAVSPQATSSALSSARSMLHHRRIRSMGASIPNSHEHSTPRTPSRSHQLSTKPSFADLFQSKVGSVSVDSPMKLPGSLLRSPSVRAFSTESQPAVDSPSGHHEDAVIVDDVKESINGFLEALFMSEDYAGSEAEMLALLVSGSVREYVVQSMQSQVVMSAGHVTADISTMSSHCQLLPVLGVGFGISTVPYRIYSRHLAGPAFDACVRLCHTLLTLADARRDYPCAAALLQLSTYIQRDGDMTTWTSDATSRIEGQALPVTTPRHRHAKSHNFTFETNRVHHHGAHSLLSHINQHDIWKKMPFWEFYIVRVTAFRPQFSSNSADGSNRSVSPSSRHLSSAVTPTRQGMPAFTDTRTSEEVIFQVLCALLPSMADLGLPESQMTSFILRVSSRNNLPTSELQLLQTMARNVCSAVARASEHAPSSTRQKLASTGSAYGSSQLFSKSSFMSSSGTSDGDAAFRTGHIERSKRKLRVVTSTTPPTPVKTGGTGDGGSVHSRGASVPASPRSDGAQSFDGETVRHKEPIRTRSVSASRWSRLFGGRGESPVSKVNSAPTSPTMLPMTSPVKPSDTPADAAVAFTLDRPPSYADVAKRNLLLTPLANDGRSPHGASTMTTSSGGGDSVRDFNEDDDMRLHSPDKKAVMLAHTGRRDSVPMLRPRPKLDRDNSSAKLFSINKVLQASKLAPVEIPRDAPPFPYHTPITFANPAPKAPNISDVAKSLVFNDETDALPPDLPRFTLSAFLGCETATTVSETSTVAKSIRGSRRRREQSGDTDQTAEANICVRSTSESTVSLSESGVASTNVSELGDVDVIPKGDTEYDESALHTLSELQTPIAPEEQFSHNEFDSEDDDEGGVGVRSLDQVLFGGRNRGRAGALRGRSGTRFLPKLRSVILKGHKPGAAVTCMDTKGERLVTGGTDDAVYVWDTKNFQFANIGVSHSHEGPISAVRFVDDVTMVSASRDGVIRVHTLAPKLRGKMKNHKMKGHDGPIVCMDAWEDMPTLRSDASTADGVKSMTEATKYCKMRVISGGMDGRVCIWDGRKGKMLLSYPAHSGAVQCAKVSWDGNRAATGGRDGMVCDWDLVKCVETHKFAGHSDAVVTLHVGQRFIASGSTDGLIKIWDVRAGGVAMTLCGHTCPVWCLKATDTDVDTMSDLTIVSGGDDGRIKLWDLRSAFGGSRLTLTGHTDMITSLSLDWTKLVSGSKDGSVRIWDVVSGSQLETCLGHSDTVSSVNMHDNHVASASWDGTVRCWFG